MKHTKLIIPFATALLTLTVPPVLFAADAPKSGAVTTADAAADGKFMQDVIHGNLTEIKAAKIAEGQTKREDVKNFAKSMEKDHTDVNKNLMTLVDRMKLKLSKDPGEHQPFLDGLKAKAKANDPDFDHTYVAAAVESHEKCVKMFETFSSTTKNADLKAFADNTLPGLKTHLKHSQDLLATLNGKK